MNEHNEEINHFIEINHFHRFQQRMPVLCIAQWAKSPKKQTVRFC